MAGALLALLLQRVRFPLSAPAALPQPVSLWVLARFPFAARLVPVRERLELASALVLRLFGADAFAWLVWRRFPGIR